MSEARQLISVAEYLALEEHAEFRSEYFNGQVFAMAGGTPEHSMIKVNVIRELGNQLVERPCVLFDSDQRVKISGTGMYTYADAVVVCAKPEFDESDPNSLVNPTLLLEALSPGTEAYDRGDKFAHYRKLPSLQQYVLVSSERRRIECFTRQPGGNDWLLTVCDDPDGSIRLESIGCSLTIRTVYAKVNLSDLKNNSRSRTVE